MSLERPFPRRTLLGYCALGAGSLAMGSLSRTGFAAPAIAATKKVLTLYGPPAGPSLPLAHLVHIGALKEHVDTLKLKIWHTPDQLRAGVLDGTMSITGTPTYVAANLFNRGVDMRLSSVVTWGLLYLMASKGTVSSLADVKGQTVVIPYKNDMPDLVFRAMAAKIGLREYTPHYVGTAGQAMKMMVAGKATLAILPEPAATGAQMQAMKHGVTITRALDLQKEWGRIMGGRPVIPQAGIMMSGKIIREQPDLVAAFNKALVQSARWVSANPASAAKICTTYLGLKAPIIERSIPFSHMDVKSAKESQAALEHFFTVLKGMSPAIIGGKLPASDFYQ